MPAFLELLYEGRGIVVDSDEVILGRVNACTIRVVHPLVSRQHCRIDVRAEGVFAEDLGSSNGTYVNGSQIKGVAKLHAGDRISLGRGGAELTLISAEYNGADVGGYDAEAEKQTFIAGDPRAAGLRARVSVASEALPQLEEVVDSVVDQDIDAISDEISDDVEPIDEDDDDGYEEEPPTRLADDAVPGLGPLPYDEDDDSDDNFPALDEPYVSPDYERLAAQAAGAPEVEDEPPTRLAVGDAPSGGAAAPDPVADSIRDRVRRQIESEAGVSAGEESTRPAAPGERPGARAPAPDPPPPRTQPRPARTPAPPAPPDAPGTVPVRPRTVPAARREPSPSPSPLPAGPIVTPANVVDQVGEPNVTGRVPGLLVGFLVGLLLVAALAVFTPLAAGVYKLPFAPLVGGDATPPPDAGDGE